MQIIHLNGLKIRAVYGCLPQIQLDNAEALTELYGEGTESVLKATGIRQRYIVRPGTSSLDLCVHAAETLLNDLEYDRQQLGGLISVTFTPHTLMPFNATRAHQRLQLPLGLPAFDISLACSGYGYGLWVAGSLAQATGRPILLLDGDVQSAFVSRFDLATWPVMADAGSATLIEPTGHDCWSFSFYTDGSRGELLRIPSGGSAQPATEESLLYRKYPDGSRRRDRDIEMDGFGVFKFVAQDVSKMIQEFIAVQDSSKQQCYEGFIPHQANMYMVTQLAKKIGFSSEQLWRSGEVFGNSASATVPMTIAHCAPSRFNGAERQRVLLSGFGAGLSVSIADLYLYRDSQYRIVSYDE